MNCLQCAARGIAKPATTVGFVADSPRDNEPCPFAYCGACTVKWARHIVVADATADDEASA